MALRGGFGLWFGPLLAVAGGILALAAKWPQEAAWTAAVTLLCATWWVSEALPVAATSLVPFAVFPLTGVLAPSKLAEAYGHPVILLLLGGYLLSAAMEKSGAHRRIALELIRRMGSRSGSPMVFGFMLTAALLSMWISNSATTLMLLPVAIAVIERDDDQALPKALLLGIAYASSIGGMATPIGTPPNAIFIGVFRETTGVQMSFLSWMKIGVPSAALLLPCAWYLLTRSLRPPKPLRLGESIAWRTQERRVLWLFSATALLWMTRTAPFGGWEQWLPQSVADDGTVALFAAVLLFILPDGRGERMLDWDSARTIPWGLLLLFAGGIAIAKAFDSSGLSGQIAGAAQFQSWPFVVVVFCICLGVTFLTEVTSNTATATLLMPVLAATALAANWPPERLMIPAALSASCAFMLPVATAPNAIMFGSGRISTPQMARAGLRLNLIGVVVLTGMCSLLL